MDVPEAISLPDDELDFVVDSLNSCVAEAELDGLEDMVLVAFYLGSKFLHHRYSAVARPPEPALQFGVCFLNGGHLQNQAEPFLDAVRPVKQRVLCLNHLQAKLLVLSKMLRGLAEGIYRLLQLVSFVSCFLCCLCLEVISFGAAMPFRSTVLELLGLLVGIPPYSTAHFIQGVHSPLNDVERVYAALAAGSKLIDALRNPFGTVACYDLDAFQLFLGQ